MLTDQGKIVVYPAIGWSWFGEDCYDHCPGYEDGHSLDSMDGVLGLLEETIGKVHGSRSLVAGMDRTGSCRVDDTIVEARKEQ